MISVVIKREGLWAAVFASFVACAPAAGKTDLNGTSTSSVKHAGRDGSCHTDEDCDTSMGECCSPFGWCQAKGTKGWDDYCSSDALPRDENEYSDRENEYSDRENEYSDGGQANNAVKEIEGQVVTIRVQHSKKCIDLVDGVTSNGTGVQQWTCDEGNLHQQWIYDAQTRQIRFADDPGLCLDVKDWGTAPGTPIQVWQCARGQDNQEWIYKPSRSGNGVVSFQSVFSGLCLDVDWTPFGTSEAQSTNGAILHQWKCVPGQRNQQFKLTPVEHVNYE